MSTPLHSNGTLPPSREVGVARPFDGFTQEAAQDGLRAAISAAYRRAEPDCLPSLLAEARAAQSPETPELARRLVRVMRRKQPTVGIASLIHEFSLSSQEGVALMCLAEALLRIPDQTTRDALIRDKIGGGDWRAHESGSLFGHAAAWGLMITGKLADTRGERGLGAALARLVGRGGEPLIRKAVDLAMRLLGEHFVAGVTIEQALARGRRMEALGFRYSYDMLGEAAATAAEADRYYASYEHAIHAIGAQAAGRGAYAGPGISIKLSALHPRYTRAQRERVMAELLPRARALTLLAQRYDIGLNIDAEEADRLDLSLDVLAALCTQPELAGWNGIGFVIQAYQKRAPYVVDHVIDLARRTGHRLMVRLVKGAYWDTEIKRAQVDGLDGYPVYTRKVYTDVAYLACAARLLRASDAVYPQFATHNAHTVAAIHGMAGPEFRPGQYEFQCLHGMGEALYTGITPPVAEGGLGRPCRIYAPVGAHDTLLAYLVRRLLENGANTSFVHQVADDSIGVDALIADPIAAAQQVRPLGAPHPRIPLPRDLYQVEGDAVRVNSRGLDLSSEQQLTTLAAELRASVAVAWRAAPTGLSEDSDHGEREFSVRNPADHRDIVGRVVMADAADVDAALMRAVAAAPGWRATPVTERAACLLRAADLLESRMPGLLGLIMREAGKSCASAIAEVREAVDFLRYYAQRIQTEFADDTHIPLGPVVCISPWNFPLAIFLGQVAAALAAGNPVLAKPAEQTVLIAAQGLHILHEAGIPEAVVQLLPGEGATVGRALTADARTRAVVFTGSTEVAGEIARTLAARLDDQGQTIPLVAETGGQNAMIVDSSALAEQVVQDVMQSAFDSAGQRCSALRILCLQDDIADRMLVMIRGAMQELRVGNPDKLASDVGPVVDADAHDGIMRHIATMRARGFPVEQLSLPPECRYGTFVPPTLIRINAVTDVEREVFGPVLHVLRFARGRAGEVIDAVNATRYGLTFGVHSRIDETVERLAARIRAGNVYVNRNMIGAVVGVQPFGGEGRSGTGPKAGGPWYVRRLLVRHPVVSPPELRAPADALLPLDAYTAWLRAHGAPSALEHAIALRAATALQAHITLPGPTGERNTYRLAPRGPVLCLAATDLGAQVQLATTLATGNPAWFVAASPGASAAAALKAMLPRKLAGACELVPNTLLDASAALGGVLYEGEAAGLLALNQRLARRDGAIVQAQRRATTELAAGVGYLPERLLREIAISVNTAAAGGNATLMTLD